MGEISTPYLSYSDIDTEKTDLLEDAWGFISEFPEVYKLLSEFRQPCSDRAANRLLKSLTQKH